jgi:hypothetical protein
MRDDHTSHPRKIAAATLVLLALAAPAASAQPIIDRPIDAPAQPASTPPMRAADESFDWSSAAAGAAAGIVLVAAGGFAAARRTRLAS